MKKKFLKRVTVASLILMFVLTGSMFAYWIGSVIGDDSINDTNIIIGIGDELTTTLNVNLLDKTEGSLVPLGYADAGEVESVVITYNVSLVANDVGANDSEQF